MQKLATRVNTQKSTKNPMSSFGIIKENIELSHFHLAVQFCFNFQHFFFLFSAVNKKPTPTQPPSFSRKIKVLSFILGCCCMVAIIVNFINLHSDYEEVHEFYIGFMGRKMLIQERRLTSRSYLNMLRREHLLNVEVCSFLIQPLLEAKGVSFGS